MMSLKSQFQLFATSIGDLLWNAAQQAAVGSSFGNGALTANAAAANPLQMGESGNLIVQTVSAGRNPANTGSDYIVALATIPANAFDVANRGLSIMASGTTANATSKTFKIIVNPAAPAVGSVVSGGTTIATLGPFTTNTAGGWENTANIFKYGAAGSNTQIAIHEAGQVGANVASLIAPSLLTLNEAAPIVVAITINAATAADAAFNFLQIIGMN